MKFGGKEGSRFLGLAEFAFITTSIFSFDSPMKVLLKVEVVTRFLAILDERRKREWLFTYKSAL
jgi:hypothetical protein